MVARATAITTQATEDKLVMVNVLITGYTSQHIGNSHKSLIKYQSVSDIYAQIFRDLGHTVTHTRAVPEMDLSPYDLIVCGQITLNALGSTYAYGALDAIARARAQGKGLMFFFDDWQVKTIVTALTTLNNDLTRLIRPSLVTARADHQWATENLERIAPVVEAMKYRPWPVTLVPFFNWGDHSIALKNLESRLWVPVDVSSYTNDYKPVIPERYADRAERWVLGALGDYRDWIDGLGLTWEVERYGGRKSKADKPLTEADLVQRYADSWGTMSPPYYHRGSGWWRYRFVHAAQTGTVILADPDEVAGIDAYTKFTGPEVEQLSIADRENLAHWQRESFYSIMTPKDRLLETVRGAVAYALAEVA